GEYQPQGHESELMLCCLVLARAGVLAIHHGNLSAEGEYLVQRRQRVLENHGDVRTAELEIIVATQQVFASEAHPTVRNETRGRVNDAHHRLGSDALARPGFT